MDDYSLTPETIDELIELLKQELIQESPLLISVQDFTIGKWGMARLWRMWMTSTAKFMAGNGATMPLMINKDGEHYGTRAFNSEDAHELFTSQWLGVDNLGVRLSWSKKGHDGMRPATKGERYIAMLKHENWSVEKGLSLMVPRDSEFFEMKKEQDGI